jgi:ubiquinone/menaquinone biosynthesis C-methylase UbiE
MDKQKYDAIAHTLLRYCSPINDEMVDEIAVLMRLTPGLKVIDLGCAKAEILIRMADRCQVQAYGVDTSPQYLQAAKAAIATRVPAADITLEETSVVDYQGEPESFDAVMCVNSSELYQSYDKALMEIAKLAKPGAMVLMGDYYWRDEPQAEISNGFDVTKDYYGAIETGLQEGLNSIYASVCTQIDIDRYIWSQCYSIEMYTADNPDDEDVPAMLNHARMIRNLYVEFGHKTLGFGLFLYRKPLYED